MMRSVFGLTARGLSGYKRASKYQYVTARRWSTSGLPRVLLLDEIKLAKQALSDLQHHAEVVPMSSQTRAEFIDDCETKYKDVKAIYRHFKGTASVRLTGVFDEELVSKLPPSLKYICHNGAGYDQIDVDACSNRNIQVSNVPTAVDDATADTAMFLLLGVLRQFSKALASAQAGTFNSSLPLSNDPRGKLLGILGMGGIGRALAKRAKAFGMTVQYHNRNRLSAELEDGAQYVSYDELLRTSDVVSLNLPLNAKTKHLISTPAFEAMKPSAVLINTARGPVVDEEALIAALEKGEIAGAGLDVYEHEPKIPDGLLKSPKAFCLPHVGTLTLETQEAMEAACLNNIVHGLQKGKLGFTVPEQRHLIE